MNFKETIEQVKMDFESKYNTKVPAVKRLMLEACELKDPTEEYSAYPLEDNLFEWHFTVRGADGTDFERGIYHGRILFPNEYPMKPPNIILLTPNGRFEVNKKICLSISGYHPETWMPSWSIRTALLALIAFLPTPGKGTVGSLDYTPEERRDLARKSQTWACPKCGLLTELLGKSGSSSVSPAETKLINSFVFKGEDAAKEAESSSSAEGGERIASASPVESSPPPQQLEPQVIATGFSISETTSNILIGLVLGAISFLVYRRLFLL